MILLEYFESIKDEIPTFGRHSHQKTKTDERHLNIIRTVIFQREL
jgi:hypothetical protein